MGLRRAEFVTSSCVRRGLFSPMGQGGGGGGTLPAAPSATFTGTPLSGAGPLSVVFTDGTTGSPTSWLWQKNSGAGWVNFATPTAQNPTEIFATGTWSVMLTASNQGGPSTLARTNYVVAS